MQETYPLCLVLFLFLSVPEAASSDYVKIGPITGMCSSGYEGWRQLDPLARWLHA
jgi:hypothetical protein